MLRKVPSESTGGNSIGVHTGLAMVLPPTTHIRKPHDSWLFGTVYRVVCLSVGLLVC